MSSHHCRLLLPLLLLLTAPARAAPDRLGEFLQKYRCPTADRLQRIYETGDPHEQRHRFLILSFETNVQAYVQCLFHDDETMIYCEAASGFWLDKPGTPRTMRLAPDKIAALGGLGFSTDDRSENFKFDHTLPNPPNFGAIADLMLTALYVGYDARAETVLEFDAPFAPRTTTACDPVG